MVNSDDSERVRPLGI